MPEENQLHGLQQHGHVGHALDGFHVLEEVLPAAGPVADGSGALGVEGTRDARREGRAGRRRIPAEQEGLTIGELFLGFVGWTEEASGGDGGGRRKREGRRQVRSESAQEIRKADAREERGKKIH